ncbi:MAG: hypothetical protein JW849_09305 [Phycisphaerae bacterium]|nr:hypothetical protein [Phycisphaerae bacterium]
MAFLIQLLFLIVYYGWIVLTILALIFGLRALRRNPRKKNSFVAPAILLVLAAAWFLAVDVPGIWRNYSKIQTSDSSAVAWVHHPFMSFGGKYVCLRCGQKEWQFRLGNFEQPDPVRIFWLPGEKSIGVDYASDARDIDNEPVSDVVLDVFPIPDESKLYDRNLSEELIKDYMKDFGKWSFNGRKRFPTTAEQKYFDK